MENATDTLCISYEEQLNAAHYKAERDAAVQELQGLRGQNRVLWMEYGMSQELMTCAEEKAERLGKLVWRLQNRLAKAHRREKALRKGMRMWRERAISGPVRTVSAYDLLTEEDLQTLQWVYEQGGLDVVKTHAELFQQLKGERDELREMCRDYKNHGAYGLMLEYRRVLNGVCKRLGLTDGTGKPEQDGVIYGVLEKRLIPEGYEWPRYESGEPVTFGDSFLDHHGDVRNVLSFELWQEGGFTLNTGQGTADWHSSGERVKRPAVLAADGEPLEAGQTVWRIDTGDEYWVRKNGQIITEDAVVIIRKTNCDCESEIVKASQLTHTKPEPQEKTCGDCRFWQSDPDASQIGVCWNSYAERDSYDSYEARVKNAHACEDFAERGE